ncbi:MAG: xanthine dehydrogenase family protein molybdopterin-binding subunit [Alphaproteobacteria bacterium]
MSGKFGIAQPVRRREDERFLTGRGTFADDVAAPGALHAVFVRSDHPHGELHGIDARRALAMPGVAAVFTGADLAAAGVAGIVHMPPRAADVQESPPLTPRPALAIGRVRHVGEPVAMVVAATRAQALDAADLVAVDIAPLPAVMTIDDAMVPGAPLIWPDAPGNVCLTSRRGDTGAVERAFAAAAHVSRVRLYNNRVAANPMEPRSSIAEWDAARQHWTLTCSSQGVQYMMRVLCEFIFDIPRTQLRVRTHDVGGGFGVKEQPYPEDIAVMFAARALRRTVRWSGTRAEHFLSDNHARDAQIDAALALDADGNFTALRLTILDAMGAYISCHAPYMPLRNTANGLSQTYRTPLIGLTVKLVHTNTGSLGPYRGAGREQAAYIVERLVDAAARETGRDPVALRRQNMIPASAIPYRTPAGRLYDSADFAGVLDSALKLADWDGWEGRLAASRARGRLRGRGLACYLECVGGQPFEGADIKFAADGRVTMTMATQSQGQGHETSFRQVVADRLGLDPDLIDFVQGDSDVAPRGLATIASRSMVMAGSALANTCDKVIENGRLLAAELLETAASDIEFRDGAFRVAGTDRLVGLLDLAREVRARGTLGAGLPPGLDAREEYQAPDQFFPNGCQIAEVEIDPETGVVTVERHTAVDDVGTVINPMIVHGQLHGGLAQGIGQVLREHAVYDRSSGQLLTASFMDYAMPRAADMPDFAVGFHPVPSPANPLGAKGCGEAGITGALPALSSAVGDALSRAGGPAHIELPITPEKVWRALAGRPEISR